MAPKRKFEDLGDENKSLRHSSLLQLSGLLSEDAVGFMTAWASLSRARKHDILSRVVQLGEDNPELDFSTVFRACLRDRDDGVRERAARGLWECDDRTIIRPLLVLLTEDRSANVRAVAATSLGRFADMAQERKIPSRDATRIKEALLSAIRNEDEDLEVRRRAIEAVASYTSPEIEEILREAYQSVDSRLKQSAIYGMGRSSDIQWLPIVLRETHNEDPAIRYEAANACGQLGDESSVPHMVRLIKDEELQVQLSAIHALGALGGSLAKRALLQCVKLGDEALEEAAQAAFNSIEFDEDPLGFRFQP